MSARVKHDDRSVGRNRVKVMTCGMPLFGQLAVVIAIADQWRACWQIGEQIDGPKRILQLGNRIHPAHWRWR